VAFSFGYAVLFACSGTGGGQIGMAQLMFPARRLPWATAPVRRTGRVNGGINQINASITQPRRSRQRAFGDGEYLSLQFRKLGSAGIPVIKK